MNTADDSSGRTNILSAARLRTSAALGARDEAVAERQAAARTVHGGEERALLSCRGEDGDLREDAAPRIKCGAGLDPRWRGGDRLKKRLQIFRRRAYFTPQQGVGKILPAFSRYRAKLGCSD